MQTNEVKSAIASVAREYGVEWAYLFGSYARGEAGPDSDVDICIQKGNVRSLIGLRGRKTYLRSINTAV
jgi:predicted nucleotidyltransferase